MWPFNKKKKPEVITETPTLTELEMLQLCTLRDAYMAAPRNLDWVAKYHYKKFIRDKFSATHAGWDWSLRFDSLMPKITLTTTKGENESNS